MAQQNTFYYPSIFGRLNLCFTTASSSSLYEPHKQNFKSEILNWNGLPHSIHVLFAPGVIILPI